MRQTTNQIMHQVKGLVRFVTATQILGMQSENERAREGGGNDHALIRPNKKGGGVRERHPVDA